METNIIIKTIETKGIKVAVKVDYDAGLVSLVEREQASEYLPKKYLFANRGLEYMQGWLNILEAMKVAVEWGKKELEETHKRRQNEVADILMATAKKKK